MPTCWFCGETVPVTQVCPKCKQEFGECHSDPATHDCPGVEVNNPYATMQGPAVQVEEDQTSVPVPEAGYMCTFCGTRVDYSSQCDGCQQQFCMDHARPEDHQCGSLGNTIGEGPISVPMMESAGGIAPSIVSSPEMALEVAPPAITKAASYPNGAQIPELTISAALTEVAVGGILQACKESTEDPDLQENVDPVLAEFIHSDPNVLAMFRKFAQDPTLRDKFQNSPLTRGFSIWLTAVGADLDALAEIGEEAKVPITQMSFHELLQYYYAHLTDVAVLMEARDSGMPPRVNPLERWVQEKLEYESRGSISVTQAVIDTIAKVTREAGERETVGYLVGTRDGHGNIATIGQCVPLLLGDFGQCCTSTKELYEVLKPLANTNEMVVGMYHSHPGNSMPGLSQGDIVAHVDETYRLSLLECLKRLDLKLPFDQRVSCAFWLSHYEYAQIRYLVDVIFASIAFPPAMKPIADITMAEGNTWETTKGLIDSIIRKVGITPKPIEWPLLPFVDVVVVPDFRFIGAGGVRIDQDPGHPGGIKTTPFFYHIQVKDGV